MQQSLRKLRNALLLLAAIITVGTLGYMLIEEQNFLNALYMTIITLTTIGYGETFSLNTDGRIFTILLVLAGVGTVAYALASTVEFMVEGRMSGLMGRRKMRKEIDNLLGHYILCGYGRVGQYIAMDLSGAGVSFVVIEKDLEVADAALEMGFTVIKSDATDDETLRAAGIERAKGLVTALSSDAENLYVTLTARELCPHLFIVCAAKEESSPSCAARFRPRLSPALHRRPRMAAAAQPLVGTTWTW